MANKGFTKDYSPNTFKSAHFDESNIVAHVRFDERTVNGERVLFRRDSITGHRKGKRKGFQLENISEVEKEV